MVTLYCWKPVTRDLDSELDGKVSSRAADVPNLELRLFGL
jgi:hypothetical protein